MFLLRFIPQERQFFFFFFLLWKYDFPSKYISIFLYLRNTGRKKEIVFPRRNQIRWSSTNLEILTARQTKFSRNIVLQRSEMNMLSKIVVYIVQKGLTRDVEVYARRISRSWSRTTRYKTSLFKISFKKMC